MLMSQEDNANRQRDWILMPPYLPNFLQAVSLYKLFMQITSASFSTFPTNTHQYLFNKQKESLSIRVSRVWNLMNKWVLKEVEINVTLIVCQLNPLLEERLIMFKKNWNW